MIRKLTFNKKLSICLSVCFLMVMLLSFLFINTHDDYFIPEQGNSFTGSISYALEMGNGRYLGNFLSNYLSQRYVGNCILRGLTLFSLIVLAPSVFCRLTPCSLLLSMLLFLCPGVQLYAQAYQWAHGFYNYVPPVVFLFLALWLLTREKEAGPVISLSLFLLGIFQCLFSENSTVACAFVAASIFAFWRHPKWQKRYPHPNLAYFSGTILGSLIMFLLPRLLGLSGQLSWYRGAVGLTSLSAMKVCAGENLLLIVRLFCEFYILWFFLALLLFVKWLKSKKLFSGILLAFLVFDIFFMAIANQKMEILTYLTPESYLLVLATMSGLFAALALLFLLLEWKRSRLFLILVLAAALSFFELLFVRPIGARCLFITYSLMSAIVFLLASEWAGGCSDRQRKITAILLPLLLGVVYLPLLVCQYRIYSADQVRQEHILAQLAEGKTHIEVITLPESPLVYNINSLEMLKYTYNHGCADSMVFSPLSSLPDKQ